VRIMDMFRPILYSALCLTTTALGAPSEGRAIVADFISMTGVHKQGDRWNITVELELCNSSRQTYCILPTELSVTWRIRDRENNSEEADVGGYYRALTFSTHGRSINDLDVPSFIIPAGERKRLTIHLTYSYIPPTSGTRLCLQLRCTPFYSGDTYKGVAIFKDPVNIDCAARVVWKVPNKVWMIRHPDQGRRKL